jgi:hypothetical protein
VAWDLAVELCTILKICCHTLSTRYFDWISSRGNQGRALVDGAKSVKVHGKQVSVFAEIVQVEGLSIHADSDKVIAWILLPNLRRPTHLWFMASLNLVLLWLKRLIPSLVGTLLYRGLRTKALPLKLFPWICLK